MLSDCAKVDFGNHPNPLNVQVCGGFRGLGEKAPECVSVLPDKP